MNYNKNDIISEMINSNENKPTLAERYHRLNNQDMNYNKRITMANQNSEKLKANYLKAINYLKVGLLNNIIVYQRNILVLENGRYRLLNHSDFFNYNKNMSFNESVRNLIYIDIRDYLRAIERENRITNDYNNSLYLQVQKDINSLSAPDYSITDKIPDNAVNFLYEISLGDFDIVKSLAQLSYRIIFKPNTALYPTVILADKSLHNDLFEFFAKLTEMRFVKIELSQLANMNELQSMAYANWNNTALLTLSIESDITETESKVKTIKKVLRGQNLSIKHPCFSGKLFINNRIPFVYITESHEKYLKMKNIYGAQTIKIHSKKVSPLMLSEAFNMWFRNDFAKLGAKLYNEPKKKLVTPKITDDDILELFSNDICIFEEALDCPTNELYIVYTEYYKKIYGKTPLSFRKFRTQFAIVKNLDTCRPHHSNKSNPRCFKGIGINYEKYNELLKKDDTSTITCTKKEFAHHLLKVIRKEFPEIDY